jgi:gliding motility-associated-like protein
MDGEASVDVGSLTIAGDIMMNGKGAVRLSSGTTITLSGSILNETEEGYITGFSGGKIEKMLPPLPGSGRAATGMGMNFTTTQRYDSLLLTRTHEAWHSKGELSITKVYEFSQPMQLAGVDITYLLAQSPKVTDTYLIYRKTPQGVESVASETNAAAKRVTSKNNELFETDGLTVFPFPDLGFVNSLTPNGDGINDCFDVTGIERYPTARFVVLLSNGKIIYDVSPYSNNFCGEGLSTGTYYYMFFAEKDDRQPVKKGFFELVKEE